MAIVVKDRVQQTSTTTGTSDFVLSGTVSGYQGFSAIGDNTTYYCAVDPNTGEWEVGTGTYDTGTTTLTRTTVFESSNSGNKVDFAAGTRSVFVTYPAERAIYEEPTGNTLIDGGPLTVVGPGVTAYTTFSAALGEFYADVNSFAQLYAQNLNDGSDASADLVAFNDQSTDDTFFVDMGINSSNYSSVDYPIYTPNSSYLYSIGDDGSNPSDLFVGSADGDVILHAGGFTTGDIVATLAASDKSASFEADVNVGGALDVTGAATFGSTVLLDADPTLGLQAATKQYVDSAVSTGFVVHDSVRLATAAALSANTYNNGASGVGATLTANANGALSIDGVAVATSDRVLVKNEVASANNGAYVVTQTGSAGTPYILTRASDFDTVGAGEVATNAYFYVTAGSTNIGSSWIMSQTAAITIGTTALPFELFAQPIGYTVTSPLNLTGTTLSLSGTVAATNGGTGTATVTTGDLLYGSGTNTWSKLAKGAAYKSLVMNGSGTNVEWNAVALNQSGAVSGALGATNGGTGQSSYTVGDILYSGTVNTLSKLAGNTTTTKKFLNQTGTGSASAAPSWDAVAAADISGLGTIASQNANNVAITGGTLTGVAISGASTINASAIGGTTPAAVRGSTMEASNGIMANANSVTANYSLPSGYNGLSAGPVSVASGITVTIPSGSVWTVV